MDATGARWRVVLVRLPSEGAPSVEAVLGRPLRPGLTPFPLREFADPEEAARLAAAVCQAGALAVVLSSEGCCAVHPTELAGIACTGCGAWICAACKGAARGEPLCPTCAASRSRRAQVRRLRNWFAVLVFAAFLYEVSEWQRREADALTPPVRVLVTQLAPARLVGHERVRALNRVGEGLGRSLHDLGPFFQQEYERYTGGHEPLLRVTIRGPWAEDVRPPELADPDAGWWAIAWASFQYPRYFHGLARRHGVDPDDFGARLYVVWTDRAGDVAGESRGSRKGRVGISYLSVDEPNPAYSVVTVAHELAHVLGANDHYSSETWLADWPEGYVEPFETPLWPQTWGELMAVDRPISATDEVEVRSLFQERIGYATASEMGWIPPEQAELYYQPRLTTPEEVLEAIKASRDQILRGRTP